MPTGPRRDAHGEPPAPLTPGARRNIHRDEGARARGGDDGRRLRQEQRRQAVRNERQDHYQGGAAVGGSGCSYGERDTSSITAFQRGSEVESAPRGRSSRNVQIDRKGSLGQGDPDGQPICAGALSLEHTGGTTTAFSHLLRPSITLTKRPTTDQDSSHRQVGESHVGRRIGANGHSLLRHRREYWEGLAGIC